MATRTILVPTDFSKAARNASIYATQLAKEMKYEVMLYHVYNPPLIISAEMTGTPVLDTATAAEFEKDIEIQLKKEADYLVRKSGVPVNYKTVSGLITDEIISAEKEKYPALVVMGMKTTGLIGEFIFGSTATDVLRKIHTPLLIVPEKASFKKIEKILFANDGKIETDLVMNPALKEIIQKFHPEIMVLRVIRKNDPDKDKKMIETKIEKYFDGLRHSYHLIENNNMVEGVNEFVDLHKIDMVIMVPHRHNLFERLFNEGFTKKLAFHTHVPALSLSDEVIQK